MNKDYAVPGRICSDNGIYEAFYRELGKPRQNAPCVIRARVTGWLRAVLAFLCSAAVRRVLRAVSATAALLGAVGTAGALERGRLSPVGCLLLSAAFLFLAYLSLKPRRKAKKKTFAHCPESRPHKSSASTFPTSTAADFASVTVFPAEPISSRSE